jgi:hypothetical protein
MRILTLLATVAFTALSVPAFAKADTIDPDTLIEHIDCGGHKGHNTICVGNFTGRDIVNLHCGSYDVPITTWTHTIPNGVIAAAIDLGDSVRTCRDKGITATTKAGTPYNTKLDGTDVNSSTIATFGAASLVSGK